MGLIFSKAGCFLPNQCGMCNNKCGTPDSDIFVR